MAKAPPRNDPVTDLEVPDPAFGLSPWDKVVRHFRRFLPYYALLLAWLLMVTVVPTVQRTISDDGAEFGALSDDGSATGVQPNGANGGTGGGTAPGGTAGLAPGTTTSRLAKAAGSASTAAGIIAQTGKTAGGFVCKKGVRQFPWSSYSYPCRPKFVGNNGGATHNGVTKDSIKIAFRTFPDSANTAAYREIVCQQNPDACGDPDQFEITLQTYLDYFNKTYETYGRKLDVQLVAAHPAADHFAELRGEGQETACADATKVRDEIKAFAAVNWPAGSQAFAECAAQRKLLSLDAAYGFPEEWHRARHPYLWQPWMQCNRIAIMTPEYLGKRIVGGKAKWAGDPLYQLQTRRFGGIRSDISGYDPCIKTSDREFAKWGIKLESNYTYTFDPARWPDDAIRAVAQFKAAQINTLVIAADPVFMVFLTEQADVQDWRPEFFILGSGFQDDPGYVRLWNQNVANGHVYGMSHLGNPETLSGKKSEAAETWRRATGDPKAELPNNGAGIHFMLVWFFNAIQGAGPHLTPANVGDGMFAYPASGAPDYAAGRLAFNVGPTGKRNDFEHAGIDDSREIYWSNGKYLETMPGRRFTNGEWPRGEPKFWPNK